MGRETWGRQPEQHCPSGHSATILRQKNPDINCLFIFEGKIPNDASEILTALARTSGFELLLIITNKDIKNSRGTPQKDQISHVQL